jgi:hypothetical protein
MLHIYIAALALTTITLTTSGCGGSSNATSAQVSKGLTGTTVPRSTSISTAGSTTAIKTSPNISPAKLVVELDAICKRVHTDYNATISHAKEQQYIHNLPEFASYEKKEFTELARLVRASSFARRWKQFVTTAQALADATTRAGRYVETEGINAALREGSNISREEALLTAFATRDRLTDCTHIQTG